jgi:titin
MAGRVPTDIKAGRAVTLRGHSYAKGDRLDVAHVTELARTNALNALLSKGVLYATPDPFHRRTPAGHPTVTPLGAVVLRDFLEQEELQDAPAAPTGISVTPGNAQLTLAFTAASGATSTQGRIDGGEWASVTNGQVFTGLVNGQAYSFELRSVNAFGEGVVSSATVATPRTTSSAPLALVATPGNTSASIAFNAPSNDGGAPISEYQYKVGAGAWTSKVPACTGSPLVVTGLTNGVQVSIQLRAVNIAGNGAASTAVNVTPA